MQGWRKENSLQIPKTLDPQTLLRSFSMSPLRSGRLGKAAPGESKGKTDMFLLWKLFWRATCIHIESYRPLLAKLKVFGDVLFFDFPNQKKQGADVLGLPSQHKNLPTPLDLTEDLDRPAFLARSASAEYHLSVGEWHAWQPGSSGTVSPWESLETFICHCYLVKKIDPM